MFLLFYSLLAFLFRYLAPKITKIYLISSPWKFYFIYLVHMTTMSTNTKNTNVKNCMDENTAGIPGHGLAAVALLHLHGPQLVPDGEPAEQRVQREAHCEGPPRRRPGDRAGPLAQRRQGRRGGPPRQVVGSVAAGNKSPNQNSAQHAVYPAPRY